MIHKTEIVDYYLSKTVPIKRNIVRFSRSTGNRQFADALLLSDPNSNISPESIFYLDPVIE
jgi:hypothetical protein